MPSKTPKQRKLMAGNCKNPGSMKKRVPRKTACKYMRADRAKARGKKR